MPYRLTHPGRPVAVDDRTAWSGYRRSGLVGSMRWNLGALLAIAAGVVLGIIGAVALARAGVDRTWYSPVVSVLGARHTALLGAIELGVGVLLAMAGFARALAAAAFISVAAAACSLVVLIQPSVAQQQLAIQRGWALVLTIVGFALGAVIFLLRPGLVDDTAAV